MEKEFAQAQKELVDAKLLTSDKTVNSQLVVLTAVAIVLKRIGDHLWK